MAASFHSCCCSQQNQKSSLEVKSRTDLDNALNELGMLSSVTDSRQEYIQEKLKKETSIEGTTRPSLCILQMNSNFVALSSYHTTSDDQLSNVHVGKVGSKILLRDISRRERRMRLDKPYFRIARKTRQKDVISAMLTSSLSTDSSGTTSSNSSISRQDSGNKSNPGSPIKSQKSVAKSRCSIIRSRSLDDLEISNLSLSDCCNNGAGKAEIDTVSQRISNLHVS